MIRNTLIGWVIGALLVATIVLAAALQRAQLGQVSASQPVPLLTKGLMLRLVLGLKDNQPSDWSGELKVSEGARMRVEAPLMSEARVDGATWKLSSYQLPGPPGVRQPVYPAQILATFDAQSTAEVDVATKSGRFSFKLGEISYDKKIFLLDGAVSVERLPLSTQLTHQQTEDDFPATAVASDGTIWCAYVAYRNGNPIRLEEVNRGQFASLVTTGHGDQIKLLRMQGNTWSPPIDVTKPGLDLWRPTVAVDGKGRVSVIWSESVNGNWDLYMRHYNPAVNRWSDNRRLTFSKGPNINVVAATDHSGRVWVAWQGWADNAFNLMYMMLDDSKTLQPVSVTFGGGNNWSPAIAADSKGHVYIAWDHYAEGNYDVALETIDARTQKSTRLPLAHTALYEARPSIVVDRENRVWVAYEESDANWGKDFGSRWTGPSGVPFYADVTGKGRRDIRVRVIVDGKVMQPAGDLDSGMSERLKIRKSFPRLGLDGAGRVWLTFRHHGTIADVAATANTFQQELWSSWATYYDGRHWAAPRWIPNSTNLLDNRPALLPLPSGNALVIYSSDGRSGNNTTAKTNNLYAALLQGEREREQPVLSAATVTETRAEPVHPNEKEDIAHARAYRVTLGRKTYQLLRGEFHRHSEFSSHRDQDGPFEDVWRYSLDVARMDWIGPGDHDNGVGANNISREYTWWLTQKQVDIYHLPPVFVPMFTYERSVIYPSGHRNVMFDRRGIRPLPRLGTPKEPDLLFGTSDKGAPDVKNLYAYLKHFGGICSPHTSATQMGTDWRDNDVKLEPVVEIYQGHRQNYEEPSAPMAARGPEDSIGGYEPAGFVWNAFRKGYRLGFQVSSDHVSTHLSYAIVFAENPTRQAILDAFKKRHTYGAQDNIVLDVHCGEHLMGDEFTLKTKPKLEITVMGTATIARLDIVRQVELDVPRYVHTAQPNKKEIQLAWMDNEAKPNSVNMYYIRVQQADNKFAWSSPLWVTYVP